MTAHGDDDDDDDDDNDEGRKRMGWEVGREGKGKERKVKEKLWERRKRSSGRKGGKGEKVGTEGEREKK